MTVALTRRHLGRLFGTGIALVLLVAGGTAHRPAPPAPDFGRFPAGELRKAAFFDYLGPLIDEENARWRERRRRLEQIARTPPDETDKADVRWLATLADFFDVGEYQTREQLIDALLYHVDTVPRPLALAQAAKESAWGTSRFSRQGNAFFGQRCYEKGCGLVPDARPRGARYEVRTFDSPRASVASYVYNINTHLDYAALRDYRSRQRQVGERVSGIAAAERLTQYSERRGVYVDEIQSLIHFNGLEIPADAPDGDS